MAQVDSKSAKQRRQASRKVAEDDGENIDIGCVFAMLSCYFPPV